MSKESRKQLMVEFMQSYRTTGQLFYKLVHYGKQGMPKSNTACLPILKVLKQQGNMSQSAIARELYHSDAAVSRQVGILLEDKLVSTAVDKDNRRATIVQLTVKGEEMLDAFETNITDFMTDILSEVPNEKLHQLIQNNCELQEIIATKIGKEL